MLGAVAFGDGAGLGPYALGADGVALDELTRLGVPVLPGFTVPVAAELDADTVRRALCELEERTGQRLDDPVDPLLLVVRASAAMPLPGIARPVLDVGLTARSVHGLARQAGEERFAHEARRQLVQALARSALAVPGERLEEITYGIDDPAVAVDALLAEIDFPDDPVEQVLLAVAGVRATWDAPRAARARRAARADESIGVAVHVQAMAHGVAETSGAGTVLSRDPETGAATPVIAFGAGVGRAEPPAGEASPDATTQFAARFPEPHRALLDAVAVLERHHRDLCEIDFAVAGGRLWVLRSGPARERGPAAAVEVAVALASAGVIDRDEAIGRVRCADVERLLHPRFASSGATVLTQGLGASPGAACGRLVLTADAAAAGAAGGPVILVRPETGPDDLHGMIAAAGILTARGGLASHAAVVARGMGRPAVCGAAAVEVLDDGIRVGDTFVAVGEWLGIDGGTGVVVLGDVEVLAPAPAGSLDVLLQWADEHRRLGVRANADTAADATTALAFGAEGIGLCRTEHQFLGDRLPLVRRMLLARSPDEEARAAAELAEAQRADFDALLDVMGDRPVTVRLLDPPLHEFLPRLEDLVVAEARGALDDDGLVLLRAARALHEANPMLGTRGVRLAVLKPWLYPMQARALFEAAAAQVAKGRSPHIEIMIPLVVAPAELAHVADAIEAVAAECAVDGVDWQLGTMIETPRAALAAGDIAERASFFSFGTNDLTQLTFGFSRDDVEGALLPAYLSQRLLPANPFATLDEEVAGLVRSAVAAGRAARADLKTGICGEHGGDPVSIFRCHEAGLDYVSCSPYRLPVARLAAAQAALGAAPGPD